MGRRKAGRGAAPDEPGPPRFDPDLLARAAGDKVFARGREYHRDGLVVIVALGADRATAEVHGSDIYRTEVRLSGGQVGGQCTCPAFADRGFCKHMVATALAANGLTPEDRRSAADRPDAIRVHLRAQGVEPLIEIIMGLAERDPALRRRLDLAAMASDTDEKRLFERYRRALDEATRTRGYVEYGEAHGWAEGILQVLDPIERLVDAGRADTVVRLIDHLVGRLEPALEQVDDSDGHAAGIVERTHQIHRAACAAAQPDPVALARHLFAAETSSDWGFFHDAARAYADVLGAAGLAEYRRLAEAAWNELPPPVKGKRMVVDDDFGRRHHLTAILDAIAERAGDLDARIALRIRDLSSAYAYLDLAQLCLDNGRRAEAVTWAEEGVWRFEDEPDDRLTAFAADLYAQVGRESDARALLWRDFERMPRLDTYKRIAAVDGDRKGVAERATAFLRGRLDGGPSLHERSGINALADILMFEDRVDDAWQLVRAHRCDDSRLERLAVASAATHPRESLEALGTLVERAADMTSRSGYERACALISRMKPIRQRLGEEVEHVAWLGDLARRHKARRNFVKLLQERAGAPAP